jgi:hypothetical protein
VADAVMAESIGQQVEERVDRPDQALQRPTYAWSYKVVTGKAGAVSVPYIYIGDLLMPYGIRQLTLYGNSPIAYRSPATTGSQIVSAQYYVEKWNGSAWFITAKSPQYIKTISGTQAYVLMPKPYIQPVQTVGTFRVTWLFTWSTSTGAPLGGVKIIPKLASDHVCVTPYRYCKSSPGYFVTGNS